MLKSSLSMLLGGLTLAMLATSLQTSAYASQQPPIIKPPLPKTEICQISKADINLADEKSLMQIRGLGKYKARAIMHYREKHGPILSLDDLQVIKGITPALIEKMKGHFTATNLKALA